MKTRIDFVSNSSSCSFVISCQQQYLDAVSKDLAKACTNKKSSYHIKDLDKLNKLNLDFCLKTYRLAFLGELLLETKKKTYNLAYFEKIFKHKEGSNIALREWERYKNNLAAIKNGTNVQSWLKKEYGLDEYDASTDTATHYEKIVASGVIVSRDIMEYRFNRYHFVGASPDDDKTVACRVESLVKTAKMCLKLKDSNDNSYDAVEIYQITKDTVDNTRDLIAAGYSIELDEWEDLDQLEARLASGNAIFYVRIANSGDGIGDFHIYCDDDAEGLEGVSGIEILTSDSL